MAEMRKYCVGLFLFSLFFSPFFVYASDRFTDNGDGTVTDHQLSLMWAQSDNRGNISWKDAEKWVRFTFPSTVPGNYSDWRLPTLLELQSLYLKDKNYSGYETDCGQFVRITSKIQISCGWIWTSEEKSITARVYNFNRGYHYTDRKVHSRGYRALPVRSLKK